MSSTTIAEVLRLLDADRGEAAEPHEKIAVAGDHGDAAVGPRQREPKPDHRGAAHRAPEIKIERMVAGGRGIVGRRAEPGDDQQIAAIGEKHTHEFAAVKHHRVHCLRPISRCDNRMATWRLPSNAMSQPAPTMSSTSLALSIR